MADRPAGRCLVAVHPHPDDESIAMGGTLARCADRAIAAHVVTCTGGEAGDNLARIDLGGRTLTEVRRDEMAEAAAILGLASHTWLGYRDSGMAGTATNDHPDAFVNVDRAEAGARLAVHLRALRPQVVASDDERGTYGHPDHVKAHHVAVAAVALAADPAADLPGEPHRVVLHVAHARARDEVRALHEALRSRGLVSPFTDETVDRFGVPRERIACELDVRDQLERKRAAMLAHRSQIGPDSAFFNVPADLAHGLFARESYLVVSSAVPLDEARACALRTDLFPGWVS